MRTSVTNHGPSMQELVSALACGQANALVDELHICLLRALAANETKFDRLRRKLDLSMLDQVRSRNADLLGTGHAYTVHQTV